MSSTNFLPSYNKFISSLRSLLLEENNPDILLTLAKLYGGVCSANHDDIYFDEDIEKFLVAKLAPHFKEELSGGHKRGEVVLIATLLHDAFGHSAVVDKWLRIQGPESSHKLIITNSITSKMTEKVSGYNVFISQCRSIGMAGIKEILFAASHAKMVVLHISPDDVNAMVAARLLKSIGVTMVFYNHADHRFSYGISGADIVCEISSFGRKLSSRSNRVLGRNFFLGIPLVQASDKMLVPKSDKANIQDFKTVLSCGSSYKYKPDGGLDFNIFINSLLEARNDVQVVLVGPTGKETWWTDSITRWGKRLKFLGVMPADHYSCLLKEADVYVDSYPICGGTAFPEALLAGVATVGLTLPMQGYSFADELRVDNVDSLVKMVSALLDKNNDACANMERVRAKVISCQAESAFKIRLDVLYSHNFDNDDDLNDIDSSKINDFYYHLIWLKHKQIHILTRAIRELPIRHKFNVSSLIFRNHRFISPEDLFKTLFQVLNLPMWLMGR